MLHKAREDLMFILQKTSEAKYKTIHRNVKKNRKHSKPQKVLKRLPIALGKVKAGSISERLHDNINKILYYKIKLCLCTNQIKLLKKYVVT